MTSTSPQGRRAGAEGRSPLAASGTLFLEREPTPRVDPALVEALGQLFLHRHVGRANAATSTALLRELAEVGYVTKRRRSIGEAVDVLLDRIVICSTSADGYWVADCLEDIEESLAEQEKRARKAFRRRSRLKMRLREFAGQRRTQGAA